MQRGVLIIPMPPFRDVTSRLLNKHMLTRQSSSDLTSRSPPLAAFFRERQQSGGGEQELVMGWSQLQSQFSPPHTHKAPSLLRGRGGKNAAGGPGASRESALPACAWSQTLRLCFLKCIKSCRANPAAGLRFPPLID